MHWAQLCCLSDENQECIPISGNVFSIGRAQSCDLAMPNSKVISGKHCCISNQDGSVMLEDRSTNGTWLNGVKIGKGMKKRLSHGDEIAIVLYSGKKMGENIVYKFEETGKLDDTQPLGNYDEDTEDYPLESKTTEADTRKRKNAQDDIDPAEPAAKRQELEEEEKGEVQPVSAGHVTSGHVTCGHVTSVDENVQCDITDDDDETSDGERAAKPEDGGSRRGMDEPSGGGREEKLEEEGRKEEKEAKKDDDGAEEDAQEKDDIMESLICSICQDILHNCISLQPCMHSFCAACFSGWMKRSKRCPTCRKRVRRVGHNYIVNSLVDAYLKQHPDKKRSKEELDEMDANNKVPFDKTLDFDDADDNGDDDDESDFDPSDSDEDVFTAPQTPPPRRPRACRQCAHYVQPLNRSVVMAISSSIDSASTSTSCASSSASTSGSAPRPTKQTVGGSVPMPTAPPFQCDAKNINHRLCSCCYEPMPVRQSTGQDIPPQKCCVCSRFYCHMYWGCWKHTCLGCLNKFKDIKFNEAILDTIINNNRYESTIFKDFMRSQGASSVGAILQKTLDKLNAGDISTTETQRCNMTGESAVCYKCALKIFQQLAYKHRASIKRDDLPVLVTARSDCHWGKNCRTQFNKPHHAANFNHVCEQTRF